MITSCTQSNNNNNSELGTDLVNNDGKLPVMTFTDTFHNFGKINQGEIVTYTFDFKNTGDGTLIVEGASSSCGCTIPEKPEEPIPSGGNGHITVKFDSNNKSGVVHKEVYLTSNTRPSRQTLYITADIQTPNNQ
jgi:hypothetical protein